ncbi:ribosome-binding factor A [Erysipelothrix larvae]|uniref:Ribosome-binding factor A n=1 Tax=Erysipelothrix larvae TaxID=1514105 RepID=A0A0X8GZK6_9FIRM|nr:30S ribosome-binding factor RbfA [Erysipelothrix larvae]AMC93326.1 ribosome-binding factor A [Erysipelothrix larvae]
MTVKKERIESIIKRVVSSTIANRLNDPALKFMSVTDVEVTNDLSFATIFVSFFEETNKVTGMEVLEKAKGLLRTEVSKSLDTRRTPELIFKLDESLEYGSKIEGILKQINDENKEK